MTSVPKELEKTARFYDILYGGNKEDKDELIQIIRDEDKLFEFLLLYEDLSILSYKNVRFLNEVIEAFKDKIVLQSKEYKMVSRYYFIHSHKRRFDSPLIVNDMYTINKRNRSYTKIFKEDTLDEYYRITEGKETNETDTIYSITQNKQIFENSLNYYWATMNVTKYLDYCIYYDYYNIFKHLYISFSDDISKISLFCAILGNHSHTIEMIRMIQQSNPLLFEDDVILRTCYKLAIRIHNKDLIQWFAMLRSCDAEKDTNTVNGADIQMNFGDDKTNFYINYRELSLFPELVLETYKRYPWQVTDFVFFKYLSKNDKNMLYQYIENYFTYYVYNTLNEKDKIVSYCLEQLTEDREYKERIQTLLDTYPERITFSIASIIDKHSEYTLPKINTVVLKHYRIEYLIYLYETRKEEIRKEILKFCKRIRIANRNITDSSLRDYAERILHLKRYLKRTDIYAKI